MKNASKWLENAIFRIRNHDSEIAKNETAILQILLEIENRKEYSEHGFDGLYSFCIKTFGWSESQTATRTQAMYAIRAVPEVQAKIHSGKMSITTVALVQRFIRQEQVEAGIQRSPEEKQQIFDSFEYKSSTQVKEEIATRKGERIKFKIALELDEEAESMWAEIRNLTAHQTQGSALNCLKVLMRNYLDRRAKAFHPETARSPNDLKSRQKERRQKPSPAAPSPAAPSPAAPSPAAPSPAATAWPENPRRPPSSFTQPSRAPSRFIPAETKRQVLARDRFQCRQCNSKHALQFDHIHPIAQGGTNDAANLQLLCRSCNLHKAIRDYGQNLIHRHLRENRIAS